MGELRESFLAAFRHIPLKRQSIITSMAVLKKSHVEDDAVSCLVVASENGDVYILDPEAFTVLKQVATLNHLILPFLFNIFFPFCQKSLCHFIIYHSCLNITNPLLFIYCLSVHAPLPGGVSVSEWTLRCGVPHLRRLQRQLHIYIQKVRQYIQCTKYVD